MKDILECKGDFVILNGYNIHIYGRGAKDCIEVRGKWRWVWVQIKKIIIVETFSPNSSSNRLKDRNRKRFCLNE